jgi:hypothetical protein
MPESRSAVKWLSTFRVATDGGDRRFGLWGSLFEPFAASRNLSPGILLIRRNRAASPGFRTSEKLLHEIVLDDCGRNNTANPPTTSPTRTSNSADFLSQAIAGTVKANAIPRSAMSLET